MDAPTPDHAAEAIKQALFNGEKILAIKLYRDQTKLGLAESKAAMEALEAELRRVEPGSFTKPPAAKGGCAMTLVVLALGIAAAIRMWHEWR